MESLSGGKPEIITAAQVAAGEVLEQILQLLRPFRSLPSLTIVFNGGAKRGIYFAGNPCRLPVRGVVRGDTHKSCPVYDPVLGKFFVCRQSAPAAGKLEQ